MMKNVEWRMLNVELRQRCSANSRFNIQHSTFVFFCILLTLATARAQTLIDDFSSLASWKPIAADGVTLNIVPDNGAMRLDIDFQKGGGYVIARKEVAIDLPENYELEFRIRGDIPPNNLELKLVDPTGDNVWWMNRQDFRFPKEWTRVRTKKRHIEFAWGPSGGGTIERVSAIEIAIAAGSGGKGSVWIDDFKLNALPPDTSEQPTPTIRKSEREIELDFGRRHEFGGLIIEWQQHPRAYDVELTEDGETWTTAYRVRQGRGARDHVYLPEAEARRVRIKMANDGVVRNVTAQPLAFSKSRTAFFEAIADEAPRGRYPKYFSNVQSYWTVFGPLDDEREALINEEGMVEVDKLSFSLEPFLFVDRKFVTWADASTRQSLEGGSPKVEWDAQPVSLSITGDWPNVRYRLTNRTREFKKGTLFVAIRPFQVNPPWQFLSAVGGVAEIHRIEYDGKSATINRTGDRKVAREGMIFTIMPSIPPNDFGAMEFDQGDITEFLALGTLPQRRNVDDHFAAASGAFAFEFEIGPNESHQVSLTIGARGSGLGARASGLALELPAEAADLVATLRSNIGYILINQDGPSIQPGSRSYDRSWIRDGALTSAALLRVGEIEPVRKFLEWFATYQYDNGKIPCCVDSRGATPVPEHDSHGQFIYLVAEFHRITRDVDMARKMWPRVLKTVEYIESLRQQRMTEEYRGTPFYGLVPESISHEGYSAKPMHSYWDDFFVLRGLKDAVDLAQVLGEPHEKLAATRDEFRRDLLASIALAMKTKNIDYIPGSVELGDFDATSTTIAISPGGELHNLPRTAVERTFEKYYQNAIQRRDGKIEWDAYTPYELRAIGTFIHLGWRDRAHELLDFFMRDRRPLGWNHWAEVVWRDPKTPKFIGDMPHTWVGSDFIRSFLDMLAYERESDGALLLAEGLPDRWLQQGVRVDGLRTHYGELAFSIKGDDVRVWGVDPPGGVWFRGQPVRTVVQKR